MNRLHLRLAQLVRKDEGFAKFVTVEATMGMNDLVLNWGIVPISGLLWCQLKSRSDCSG